MRPGRCWRALLRDSASRKGHETPGKAARPERRREASGRWGGGPPGCLAAWLRRPLRIRRPITSAFFSSVQILFVFATGGTPGCSGVGEILTSRPQRGAGGCPRSVLFPTGPDPVRVCFGKRAGGLVQNGPSLIGFVLCSIPHADFAAPHAKRGGAFFALGWKAEKCAWNLPRLPGTPGIARPP